MKQLKECPECKALLRDMNQSTQHCEICGYWTWKGTARLEQIMVC
ncbi:hypothetical protein Mpsy_0237 [Methanolobus psychrophilus R15]|nr:hypothetical protein Mpsy_0237 [Methanolobus psychrophilus R15]